MMRNQYPLAEYQANRDTAALQTVAQGAAATLVSSTPGNQTLLEILETAQAAGLVLIQKRGRFAFAPEVLPGWSKVAAGHRNPASRLTPCVA